MTVTHEQRIALFASELSLIHSPALRNFAEYLLGRVPDYFFHVPASSSGKYHPAYCLGEGGLVRHTKAAIGIFQMISQADIDLYYMNMDTENEDLFIKEDFDEECVFALLFHDALKWGFEEIDPEDYQNRHTLFEHPLLAAEWVKEEAAQYKFQYPARIQRIASAIATHMGKWTISKYSVAMLPSPDLGSWLNKIVHLCDFLASRKRLEYKFVLPEEPNV